MQPPAAQPAYESAVRRVAKLLKLANSANEHEAAVAAAQAARLMERYQIEQAELALLDEAAPAAAEPIESDHDPLDEDEGLPLMRPRPGQRFRLPAWYAPLLSGIDRAFSTRHYYRGGRPRLFGRQSAVQAGGYVFQFLVREIERLTRERARCEPGGRPGRSWYASFRLGAAYAVQDTLSRQARERTAERAAQAVEARAAAQAPLPGSPVDAGAGAGADVPPPRALVRLGKALERVEQEEHEVEREYERFSDGWRTHRGGGSGSISSSSGFSAGSAAGRSIQITGARAGLGAGAARLRP